jgi:Spy/CpxP family protein refolding chaperone
MSSLRRNPAALILGAALLAALALPVAAQTALAQPAVAPHPFGHLLRCLSVVNLTDAEKADIKAILEVARPQAETILATLKADREALAADLAKTPPDPCADGKDALQLHTDREAARTFFESVRDQVLAVLTPAQKAKVEGCLAAPGPLTASTTGEAPGPVE